MFNFNKPTRRINSSKAISTAGATKSDTQEESQAGNSSNSKTDDITSSDRGTAKTNRDKVSDHQGVVEYPDNDDAKAQEIFKRNSSLLWIPRSGSHTHINKVFRTILSKRTVISTSSGTTSTASGLKSLPISTYPESSESSQCSRNLLIPSSGASFGIHEQFPGWKSNCQVASRWHTSPASTLSGDNSNATSTLSYNTRPIYAVCTPVELHGQVTAQSSNIPHHPSYASSPSATTENVNSSVSHQQTVVHPNANGHKGVSGCLYPDHWSFQTPSGTMYSDRFYDELHASQNRRTSSEARAENTEAEVSSSTKSKSGSFSNNTMTITGSGALHRSNETYTVETSQQELSSAAQPHLQSTANNDHGANSHIPEAITGQYKIESVAECNSKLEVPEIRPVETKTLINEILPPSKWAAYQSGTDSYSSSECGKSTIGTALAMNSRVPVQTIDIGDKKAPPSLPTKRTLIITRSNTNSKNDSDKEEQHDCQENAVEIPCTDGIGKVSGKTIESGSTRSQRLISVTFAVNHTLHPDMSIPTSIQLAFENHVVGGEMNENMTTEVKLLEKAEVGLETKSTKILTPPANEAQQETEDNNGDVTGQVNPDLYRNTLPTDQKKIISAPNGSRSQYSISIRPTTPYSRRRPLSLSYSDGNKLDSREVKDNRCLSSVSPNHSFHNLKRSQTRSRILNDANSNVCSTHGLDQNQEATGDEQKSQPEKIIQDEVIATCPSKVLSINYEVPVEEVDHEYDITKQSHYKPRERSGDCNQNDIFKYIPSSLRETINQSKSLNERYADNRKKTVLDVKYQNQHLQADPYYAVFEVATGENKLAASASSSSSAGSDKLPTTMSKAKLSPVNQTPSKTVSIASKPQPSTTPGNSTPSKTKSAGSNPQSDSSIPKSAVSNPNSIPSEPNSSPSKPNSTTSKPKSAASKPDATPSKPKSTASKPYSTSSKPMSAATKSKTTEATSNADKSKGDQPKKIRVPKQKHATKRSEMEKLKKTSTKMLKAIEDMENAYKIEIINEKYPFKCMPVTLPVSEYQYSYREPCMQPKRTRKYVLQHPRGYGGSSGSLLISAKTGKPRPAWNSSPHIPSKPFLETLGLAEFKLKSLQTEDDVLAAKMEAHDAIGTELERRYLAKRRMEYLETGSQGQKC